MKGKLIIFEGSDGSGKETQSKKLFEKLIEMDKNVKQINFPDYDNDSSALVKMYLRGDFGDKPSDVNPYISSTFYSVDRFASFKTSWEDFYNDGGIIVADRYTTSNMVHQASKIQDLKEKDTYLDWLWDLEFIKFSLPVPDIVIFLNISPEYTLKLMENRNNKITGEEKKDIHEKDERYLHQTYENALYVTNKYDWKKIDCVKDNKLRSIEDIHNEITKYILSLI